MELTLIEQPAGELRTALPFYPHLDDKRFEEFCTVLLNMHPAILCEREGKVVELRVKTATKLNSGTAQRGVDIVADMENGEVWRFQCKRVKEFHPRDVAKVIELAEKGFPHADQFVLVITCGLSEPAIAKIKNQPRWDCWDALHLTSLTVRLRPREDARNLVHQFFGPQLRNTFFWCGDQPLLKWQEFFAQDLSPERRHFHHRIQFVPWSNTLSQLEAFASSGVGRALVLCAAGGQGKSRLLLELAQRLERKPRALRVRFMNPNRQGLSSEQGDFLAEEEEDTLLVVDDAHRLDKAIEEIARATAKSKTVRLLVATRPQALAAVESQLYRNGYAEKMEPTLHLPRWNEEGILNLAEQVLGAPHRHHAPRLVGLADRCPLLVVLGGALVASGHWPEEMTGGQAFRERVFRSFKEDFLSLQPESKQERLGRLMGFLSFVSPAAKNDTFWNSAARVIDCSPMDVAQDIELLEAAGLVVENREGVRLYPDLFADAVLLDACLDHGGKPSFLHREVLSTLALGDFPALMRNLAQADWEARAQKKASCSLFDPIWDEFVRRFEGGDWVPKDWFGISQLIAQRFGQEAPKAPPVDRADLLREWASFAVFLPERTLDLAELAIKSAKTSSASVGSADAFAQASAAIPPLLRPIAIWHPSHAERALDILWSLNAGEPANWSDSSNAIATIAAAATFEVHKPIRASEIVMDWLEHKFQDPVVLERLRGQPWIGSALLKPFFGREAEQTELTGRMLHLSTSLLCAERTRPLRQKALSLAGRFVCSGDRDMVQALLPVVRAAVDPVFQRFGGEVMAEVQAAWVPDRLEALKVLEKAVEAHRNSPPTLLQIRPILLNRCQHDPDEPIRKECRRILSLVPDTFELRVLRVLTSLPYDEFGDAIESDSDSDFEAAEQRWNSFCRSVAQEVVQRYKTAQELCGFVGDQVRRLTASGSTLGSAALFESIAEFSTGWCVLLLEEMLVAEDKALDGFFWPVIRQAATTARDAYRKAVECLPTSRHTERLCTLINYLGWQQHHGAVLEGFEKEAILQAAKRSEEAVLYALASVSGHRFRDQPAWAMKILCQLKPAGERDADAILRALRQLAEKHASKIKPEDVALCLGNLGGRCVPETTSDKGDLEKVARWFPKQVYEQIRDLHEQAAADTGKHHPRQFIEAPSLGPIRDPDYVEQEISALWTRALFAEDGSFAQRCRLALIRSLLWSEGEAAADRLGRLVAESRNGDELRLLTELAGVPGSRFVFDFPDHVRALLTRGHEFGVGQGVREILWHSACGGGRSFTNNELHPEYRYILEQGEALANRYRHDAVLSPFYRLIADSERRHIQSYQRAFAQDEDLN